MSYLQKSIILVVATLFAFVKSSDENFVDGACPTYEANLDFTKLNMTFFGGLWYEYVYSPEFLEGDNRECATWNLLHHNVNGTHEVNLYDVLLHGTNKTANTSGFKRNALLCGKSGTADAQRCQYFL